MRNSHTYDPSHRSKRSIVPLIEFIVVAILIGILAAVMRADDPGNPPETGSNSSTSQQPATPQ